MYSHGRRTSCGVVVKLQFRPRCGPQGRPGPDLRDPGYGGLTCHSQINPLFGGEVYVIDCTTEREQRQVSELAGWVGVWWVLGGGGGGALMLALG